jgi:hypothetical protein
LEFLLFTQNKLKATMMKWQLEAESVDLFPFEVERRLSWIEQSLAKANLSKTIRQLPMVFFKSTKRLLFALVNLFYLTEGS